MVTGFFLTTSLAISLIREKLNYEFYVIPTKKYLEHKLEVLQMSILKYNIYILLRLFPVIGMKS